MKVMAKRIMIAVVGAGIGALAGLVGGLLVSGLVLMVLGWMRAAKTVKQLRGNVPQAPPPA